MQASPTGLSGWTEQPLHLRGRRAKKEYASHYFPYFENHAPFWAHFIHFPSGVPPPHDDALRLLTLQEPPGGPLRLLFLFFLFYFLLCCSYFCIQRSSPNIFPQGEYVFTAGFFNQQWKISIIFFGGYLVPKISSPLKINCVGFSCEGTE